MEAAARRITQPLLAVLVSTALPRVDRSFVIAGAVALDRGLHELPD
jgi:hypothetical protein